MFLTVRGYYFWQQMDPLFDRLQTTSTHDYISWGNWIQTGKRTTIPFHPSRPITVKVNRRKHGGCIYCGRTNKRAAILGPKGKDIMKWQ